MNMHLIGLSGVDIARLIRTRQVSAMEVMLATRQQAEKVQNVCNPFVGFNWEQAITQARHCDQRLSTGDSAALPALFGVPFSVKDLLNTRDMCTSYGSRAFQYYQPDKDVVAVSRLRAAGAILIGKTTTPEFAAKVLTDSELTGITRNPWDTQRSPGGSSGGACVAAATGVGPLAVSTDGGGSSRIPAAACGILGLKVTMGAIPHESWPFHYGNNSSISINCRHIEDLVASFNAMSGAHTLDPWSRRATAKLNLGASAQTQTNRTKILCIPALGGQPCDQKIWTLVQQTVTDLQRAGYLVDQASSDPLAFDPGIAMQMMAANLAARVRAMTPQQQELLGSGLKILLSDKTFRSDGVRLQADAMARSQLYDRLEGLLTDYAMILTPTLNAQPPQADPSQDQHVLINGEQRGLASWWSHLAIANLTGHPAISIPCGRDADGLPVGLHALAGWDAEQTLVDLAAQVQSLHDWSVQRPTLT